MSQDERLVGTFGNGVGDALPTLHHGFELGTHAFAVFVGVDLGKHDLVARQDGVAHLDERHLAVVHDVDAVLGDRFLVQKRLDDIFVVEEYVHVAELSVEVLAQVPESFSFFLAQIFEGENLGEHRLEEKLCRGEVLDVLALKELVQDGEAVVFGLLVLLLCDKNFKVKQVHGACEVRMEVALLVRVFFENV